MTHRSDYLLLSSSLSEGIPRFYNKSSKGTLSCERFAKEIRLVFSIAGNEFVVSEDRVIEMDNKYRYRDILQIITNDIKEWIGDIECAKTA